MVQETIRYSEGVVTEVESLVNAGVFDSKSEFYRFATEALLTSINDDYKPNMHNYNKYQEKVRAEFKSDDSTAYDQSLFYSSAVAVRRYARNKDIQSAENHIDSHYSEDMGEYLLLEALLDYYTE